MPLLDTAQDVPAPRTPLDAPSIVRRGPRTIRVASVPSGHVYVRHLQPEADLPGLPRVERLRDPDPDAPSRSAQSRWWPPAMLEPEWVRANPDFDILHLQFGFDARTPAQLEEWTDALRETGRPLVYTVHDLRNPHHLDRTLHDAQLDVLVPRADALITLTDGAASEIRARWGREALVLPHPHVVDFETMSAVAEAALARESRTTGAFRVGVHVKSLRASMDPLPVLRALRETIAQLPGAVLQVNGHCDVLQEDGAKYDRELAEFVRAGADAGDIDLRVHDFFDDAALWEYLSSLDVSVLPYRFGTHSGWLEACRDLGTRVIAPSCGYYRDQGPVLEYRHDETGLDANSLDRALRAAYDAGPAQPETIAARREQRRAVATAHARLYEQLLA
ncbi:glycosyltransferase family 1 protein [Microbacterium sp. NPDC096154]|uniref:glycosyltransferase family 1 protein n=1 Tax=Microbacterium sp. NPDC096154 TaxID=3155549 RepID=UPI00332EE005